jgi:RecB family exonuclease
VENFWRTPQTSSEPANIGTACHYALEHFVKKVYIEQVVDWADVKFLKDMYELGYVETFNSTDFGTSAFADGAALVAKWYDYNKMGLKDQVLSCEVKENFAIKTSMGDIPFNYIYDRCDRIDSVTYRVVDYKSLRAPVNPADLKRKIQPRAYALAAQIKYPEAEKIWVTFDMLRYEPVGTVFTREENAETWRYLKRAAERIIAVDEDDTVETLNDECKWCIKKSTCDTLARANAGGSVFGLTPVQLAEKKMQVASQLQALKYVNDELDKELMKYAEEQDSFEFSVGEFNVKFGSRPRRSANSNAIANIVGGELAQRYGNFTISKIDDMLKDCVLTDEQVRAVKEQITTNYSDPSPTVKVANPFEE